MQFKKDTSPFFSSTTNVSKVMLQVLLALVPGTIVMTYFFGWGILINVTLSITFALTFETIALLLRQRSVLVFLSDFSAIVTAWLFALTLPPLLPWWILATGIFFAIIIAKQLYGGLGYNPFNPAMVGFAVLIVSFPLEMGHWLEATSESSQQFYSLMDSLNIVFGGGITPEWDAITKATPLDSIKTSLLSGIPYNDIIRNSYYLSTTGSNSWMWINFAFALGGIWLLFKKIIQWQIPFALLLALGLFSASFHLYSADSYSTPLVHIFSGATMLGAFFIATDPVSASTTPVGKLFYGASIGAFVYIIRTWGGYPDAIAFSVLIMNMAVPMIDYYTQPRVLGHKNSIGRN